MSVSVQDLKKTAESIAVKPKMPHVINKKAEDPVESMATESVASAALSSGVADLSSDIKALTDQVALMSSLVRSLQLDNLKRSERLNADISKLTSAVSSLSDVFKHFGFSDSKPKDEGGSAKPSDRSQGIKIPIAERPESPAHKSSEGDRKTPILKRTGPKSRVLGTGEVQLLAPERASSDQANQPKDRRARTRN